MELYCHRGWMLTKKQVGAYLDVTIKMQGIFMYFISITPLKIANVLPRILNEDAME